MRVKFTTTMEAKLVEDLKIEAIKKGTASNDILEELLKLHFGGQQEPPPLTLTEEEVQDIKKIFSELIDWSWHNATGYADEKKREASRQGDKKRDQDEIWKQSFEHFKNISWDKLLKLREYLKKAGILKDE